MTQPVLLYDGACGLCQGFVRRLLRSDRAGRMHYAPLQSEPAQAYLREQGLPVADFASLVFVPDWNRPVRGGYRLRSSGALAACAAVGGGWRVISWLRFVPAWLRVPFYRLVARTRYALFGKYRGKPLTEPEWKDRFL